MKVYVLMECSHKRASDYWTICREERFPTEHEAMAFAKGLKDGYAAGGIDHYEVVLEPYLSEYKVKELIEAKETVEKCYTYVIKRLTEEGYLASQEAELLINQIIQHTLEWERNYEEEEGSFL